MQVAVIPKLIDLIQHFWKPALESSALVLSVVNGLALFRNYLRDRAKLSIDAIHPEIYQWCFPLMPGTHAGTPTRVYGFLLYVGIANKGLRKVQIDSWRLTLRTRGWKTVKLKPLNIPDLELVIGDHRKFLPILGQKGMYLDGETLVDSGCSISGAAFYRYECYGGEGWDPRNIKGKIPVRFHVSDVFGNQASKEIWLTPKTKDQLGGFSPQLIEAIERMHAKATS